MGPPAYPPTLAARPRLDRARNAMEQEFAESAEFESTKGPACIARQREAECCHIVFLRDLSDLLFNVVFFRNTKELSDLLFTPLE
jgi:hypothetical protein